MSLYDEYERYVKTYREEYGERVVVLYRCGQFYEIYSIDDGLVDIKTIGELLNIQVSKRNKSITDVSRANSLMAGFPMFALKKFAQMLVENNFTVVIVDQITDPPKPKRAVTEVLSPGTIIETKENGESNVLMCLYIEDIKAWKGGKDMMCIGCATIDISTGISKVAEVCSKVDDQTFALDEVYRIVLSQNPKEVVVFGSTSAMSFDHICSYLELEGKCIHNKIDNFPKEILTLPYQTQLLTKVFPNHGLFTVIEYLDLERKPFSTASFVYLLQFAMKHNDTILDKISRPVMFGDSQRDLILHFNCARQLNILPSAHGMSCSLLSIINNCKTAIGKRCFKERLLCPITDVDLLRQRYDAIDCARYIYQDLQKNLGKMYDLERLYRKMAVGRLHPCEMSQIDETLKAVEDMLIGNKEFISEYFTKTSDIDKVIEVRQWYMQHIDLDMISRFNFDNIDTSFFKRGFDEEVDELQNLLDSEYTSFVTLLDRLNHGTDGNFKLEYNERDGYHYIITMKRYREAETRIGSNTVLSLGNYSLPFKELNAKNVSQSSSSLKVTHKAFHKLTETVLGIKSKLRCKIILAFKVFLQEFCNKYGNVLDVITTFIGDIDICVTHASNSIKMNYHRPVIDDCYKGQAYCNAKDIRHPIIEVVNANTEYIVNDVQLDESTSGVLLFGLNCSGKTSLSKAVALNIIMAQSGSFVPSTLTFFPFTSIFTRIPSGDDIFKSMSTFAVEMSELRSILRRADQNSLIVGDEISHGTEVTSGVAIVGASVVELAKRKSKFLFATHLHNITQIPEVTQLANVKMQHLSVHYDDARKCLVYDRKLKEGAGSSIYGLEVCKSLDLPKEFLDLANSIRCAYANIDTNIIGFHTSRYNTAVFFDVCNLCGDKSEEIHHIKPRCTANKDGYIGHVRMNAKNNLLNVCGKCHDDIHSGHIIVQGFVQTDRGVELLWNKKNDSNEQEAVNNDIIKAKKDGMTIVQIIAYIADKYKRTITRYKVNKVLSKQNDGTSYVF